MIKRYISNSLAFIMAFSLLIITSCKKDNTTNNTTNTKTTPTTAIPIKLGMYEESDVVGVDSPTYRACFMTIAKVGTQTLNDSINGLIFDTGSGGLVMDAHGIIPASMRFANTILPVP